MSIQLNDQVIALINDPKTLKVLASADQNGVPHVVFKGSVSVNADGKLQYLEIIETSQTNRNLVHSIWFRRQVAVGILTQDSRSYQIKGTPVRAVICGELFEENYIAVRERFGKDADLSTVWIIDPEEIREETFSVQASREREAYPLIGHLDRF
ncbi:hypothetical protein ACRQU7_05295 [Caproiciproducens sp. R1]|uniref:hypothetical protein n=1 Tax=Caproiciproducens sp. R1 TaxID=3435000 RepID=UPI00056E5F59